MTTVNKTAGTPTARRPRFVVHFQFCLSPGGGIGPAPLKKLWSEASECDHVRVSRTAQWNADGFVYSLSASDNLRNPVAAEAKLRSLLAHHAVGTIDMLTRVSV